MGLWYTGGERVIKPLQKQVDRVGRCVGRIKNGQ